MIDKKRQAKSASVKITFSLPIDEPAEPVWVVGDFNGWDHGALRLQKRSNGRRTASVVLPEGSRAEFRYITASGRWFDDESADGYEPNPHGGSNCLVET